MLYIAFSSDVTTSPTVYVRSHLIPENSPLRVIIIYMFLPRCKLWILTNPCISPFFFSPPFFFPRKEFTFPFFTYLLTFSHLLFTLSFPFCFFFPFFFSPSRVLFTKHLLFTKHFHLKPFSRPVSRPHRYMVPVILLEKKDKPRFEVRCVRELFRR